MVFVKFNPRKFKALRGFRQDLVRKYEGPFRIVAKVGKISYKFEFLHTSKLIQCFIQASSSCTIKTRRIISKTDHNKHPLLSPPRMTKRLSL